MSLRDKLLDPNYRPSGNAGIPSTSINYNLDKTIKCPVRFTNDPMEYIESKEFLGYKLREFQRQILDDLFNGPYSECVVIAGMRSGKSLIGGAVGSFLLHKLLAMDDPGIELGQIPGQKFSGEYIATSEQQSKQTAYSNFETIITTTPWWTKYINYLREREVKEGRETLFMHHAKKIQFLEKNLEVLSLHSNSRSLAGLTAFFVCFDEMSRFDVSDNDVQQRTEQRSAQAVYYTASRAAKTLKGFSKVVTITSPMYETDFGMQLLCMANEVKGGTGLNVINALRQRFNKRVTNLIGYHYNTFEANPKTDTNINGYTEEDFQTEKTANYATYMRDYLAIPPSAISPFFELPERVEACVRSMDDPLVLFSNILLSESVGQETRNYIGKKIQVLNPNKMKKYFICCDQGAVKDSFAVAMGHADTVETKVPDAAGGFTTTMRNKIVIDFVEAWVPSKENRVTVSFQNVEEIIRILNKNFYINKVMFDSWHSTESIERLFSEGVQTKKLGATIEMYETMKLLIYSGMVDLPNSEVLLSEIKQLNVIKGNKIEHPSGGSKDLADAVVRVVWVVYVDAIRDAVHGNFMLPMGQRFPTTRSIASMYDLMKEDAQSMSPHYGLFKSSQGQGVFGKSMIVQSNVVPNLEGKYK